MSGRRRRDDEWGDGRLDAQEGRHDPWADDGIGDWGGDRGADPGGDADRPGAPGGGYASSGGYARNAPGAQAYPSFQAGNGADGYGAGAGQRGGSNGYGTNGYAAGGYGGDGRDAGYGGGRDGYQSAGYGRGADGGNGGYGRAGYGAGGQVSDSGYGGGYPGGNGRGGGNGFNPEFAPVDNDDADDDAPASTPRPYGRLSIYTLHEDKTREFDRLAERAAEGVRALEPDTLVYVIHVVPKAPMQRIIYEIYRDRGAYLSHERQPHIRQFAADRAPCVLATNIIDLRLKYAKVAALGSAPETAPAPQPGRAPREEAAPPGDRYAAAPQYAQGQHSSPQYASAPQYSPTQYSPTQYSPTQYPTAQFSPAPGSGTAASFTPAKDYGVDNSQQPTVGREAYSPAPQYGNSGNGAYGTSNGQYDAANSNGYSGAAGYANGGGYSGNGYQSANGYSGASGYSSGNGYSGANGYQSANGYSGGNGYSAGDGYSNGSGYSSSNGYSNGSGYSAAAGNGYAAGGYAANGGGTYGASAGAQFTPRYRELTSGSQPAAEADGYAGDRYADDDRQSARPPASDWPPRSQDYR